MDAEGERAEAGRDDAPARGAEGRDDAPARRAVSGDDAPARRSVGRPVGPTGAREDILDAAVAAFGARGYEGASMRGIAADARVDPALIRHYFGDKPTLFAAAMTSRTGMLDRIARALDGPREGLGARFADAYLGLWEDPEVAPVLRAIVGTALTSPEVAATMRRLVLGVVEKVIASDAGSDLDPARVALAGMQLLGIAFGRHVVGAPGAAGVPHQDLVANVAPAIEATLTGPRVVADE